MRVTILLRKQKGDQRKDGSWPLYARIAAGTRSFKSLKICVLEEHWIASEELVSKKDPHFKEKNDIINARRSELEKAWLQLQRISENFKAIDIKVKVRQSDYQDFLSFAKKHNARYKKRHAAKNKASTLNLILEYCPGITWQHITPAFLQGYVDYQLKRGNSNNTIFHKIKYLRQLVTEAQKTKAYVFQENPFDIFHFKEKRVPKQGLSATELKSFREVSLPPESMIRRTQLVFLLQFNFIGMRIGDLLTLKSTQIKDGKLYNVTNKDEDYFEIDLTEEARSIIEELHQPGGYYLLPFVKEQKDQNKIYQQVESVTAMINQRLKIICEHAGIFRNLTTHDARRTWTQLARKKMESSGKVDPYLLMDSLGHSDLKTTGIYRGGKDMKAINDLNRSVTG